MCIRSFICKGPIPNMDPVRHPKKISLKRAIEINPKLPKIQPKDLEKVLSGVT